MSHSYEYPICDDTVIWTTKCSDYQKPAVTTAIKSKLFDIVHNNSPMTRNELIQKCNFNVRGGEALINLLAALNYLRVIDGKYFLTETTECYFLSSSPFYAGEVISFGYPGHVEFERAWNNDLKKEDINFMDMWKEATLTIEEAREIAARMHGYSLPVCAAFGKKVNLKEKFGIDTFLDVGGGSGSYSISAVTHQPNIKSIILELPSACQAADEYIAKSNIPKDSVRTYPFNMFTDQYPANNHPQYGYQAMFLSNVLHDWDVESCKIICKKIYDALPINGTILLNEMLFHDDGNGPLVTALMSFHMFVYADGKQFSFNEFKQLLIECGFKDIGLIPIYNTYSIVYGRKI